MFLENKVQSDSKKGWIEVVCGSMFSGKTEELIRRLKRAQIAKQKVEIFKPKIDDRYGSNEVVSHDKTSIPSITVNSASELLAHAKNAEVIGIDEAQFFNNDLIQACNELASKGTRVIVAGLDTDYLGNPFGPMPMLMATAEYVTKVHAICMQCGSLANHSHRVSKEESLVVLGEKDKYKALCRACFNIEKK